MKITLIILAIFFNVAGVLSMSGCSFSLQFENEYAVGKEGQNITEGVAAVEKTNTITEHDLGAAGVQLERTETQPAEQSEDSGVSLSRDVEDVLIAITKLNGDNKIIPKDIEATMNSLILEYGGDLEGMTLRDKKQFIVNLASDL